MTLARRKFLQGIAYGVLGWQLGSEISSQLTSQVAWAADAYAQKVTRSTKRKLALLIGINQYGVNGDARADWLPLNGCVTDVELQRELLVHRFGFNPQDIVTLTDAQATRGAIAQAFTEHLIAQALPGDVVVVHFSGHGSRIGSHNTLVPVDAGFPASGQVVNDLSDQTLWLWLKAIATDQITCVLDTGYNHPGTPVVGNFRIRARPSLRNWLLSPEEIALQQQLTTQLGATEKPHAATSGVILQAAANNQLCADALWQGFSSGVFTYALTQQLWQMLPATSLNVVLSNVICTLEQKAFSAQEPISEKQIFTSVEGHLANQENLPAYIDSSAILQAIAKSGKHDKTDMQSADGVVRTVTSDRRIGETWLAGLPLSPLGYYSVGSVLVASQKESDRTKTQPPTLVQVRSHNGLTAKVEVISPDQTLEPGQLLQEQIRALPRSLDLAIALDLGLSKIERVDATGALSAIGHMAGGNAAEKFADCLFGAQSASYGLFSAGRNPILGSFGSLGESVVAAIRRLQPQLEGLLAAKLIRLTGNQGSSCLGLRATLSTSSDQSGKSTILGSKVTHRAKFTPSGLDIPSPQITRKNVTLGDRLTCKLENLTDYPLYIHIFSFDPRGKVMSPSFVSSPYASDSIIPAHSTLSIPQAQTSHDWLASAPQGLVDIQIIVSRTPFKQTLDLLEPSSRQAPSTTGMMAILNPLQVAQALLSDLHQSTDPSTYAPTEEFWMLDVGNWATLSFTYRVV